MIRTSRSEDRKTFTCYQCIRQGVAEKKSEGEAEEDKEKNVMEKLREIKKNLLKHRPPGSLARDLEGDTAKPPVHDKPRTPRSLSLSLYNLAIPPAYLSL